MFDHPIVFTRFDRAQNKYHQNEVEGILFEGQRRATGEIVDERVRVLLLVLVILLENVDRGGRIIATVDEQMSVR